MNFTAAFGKPQAVLSKETLAEKIASKNGEVIELASRGRNSSGESLYQKLYPVIAATSIQANSQYTFEHAVRESESQRSSASRSLSTKVGILNESISSGKRGMVLPFEPLSLAFDEIRYAVDMPAVCKNKLQIANCRVV